MVIVAVVLLLLGPDKLPEVAHKLGSAWRSLKHLQERVESEVRDVLPDLPSSTDIARFARSPVNILNELADRASERTSVDEVPEQRTDELEEPDEHASDPVDTSTISAPVPRARAAHEDGPSPTDPSLN